MTFVPRFAARFLLLVPALLATAALAVVAPRPASAAYERDAWVYSDPAVVYAQRLYRRARPREVAPARTALVYATYGREYAAYGYFTGNQGYFYAAAYMHYVAFSYQDAIYLARPTELAADARQMAYYAYLFNWYAFVT